MFEGLTPNIGESVNLVTTDDDVLVGFTFSEPELVLDLLKSMGLETVSVDWALGEKRGKAKWEVGAVTLAFSWPDSVTGLNTTLTGCLQSSNQSLEISFVNDSQTQQSA